MRSQIGTSSKGARPWDDNDNDANDHDDDDDDGDNDDNDEDARLPCRSSSSLCDFHCSSE